LILRDLRLAEPEGIQGAPPEERAHPIVLEVYPLPGESKLGNWKALIHGDYKLAWNSAGEHALFDLARDPTEQSNLLPAQAERAQTMITALLGYLDSLPAPGAGGPEEIIDPETLEALQQLGYLR
jgi:hypothetical protein